ncbi:MAG: hypothetical protein MJ237_02115 [bacterium]|nr:hypothetical protein [bacterium]
MFNLLKVHSAEYTYILKEKTLEDVYVPVKKYLLSDDFLVEKSSQGVVISFFIQNPAEEYLQLSSSTITKIEKLKYFLAQFKNSVIIEVHTNKPKDVKFCRLKNWEMSTVIANHLCDLFKSGYNKEDKNRVYSVGYGEFLPKKNTSNNGGKDLNRVDIIILNNINGE